MNIREMRKNENALKGRVIEKEQSGSDDIFLKIKGIWERPYLCEGKEDLRNEIKVGDYIELRGFFKKNKPAPSSRYIDYFEFHYYKIIPAPEKPQKSISTASYVNPSLTKVLSFMKQIGNRELFYRCHEPQTDTIAHHVRYQLMERVIKANPSEKDLYFLTAFFDASALDYQVQSFRKNTPDFKEVLINCWKESNVILTTATHDIPKYSGKNFEFENSALHNLCNAAPGRFKQKYLLICFKIVNEKYEQSLQKTILDIIPNYTDERALRDYLISIWGIDYKLANWSLTNITGHWFVIDMHIEKAINTYLSNTIAGLNITAANADQIFRNWFGNFNDKEKNYSNLTQEQFVNVFSDFSSNECEYLPFIVTQYLWFYGKFIMTKDYTTKITKTEQLKQINQIDNICKIETGLLAPVKELYLEQPERDIYSLNEKVSFGHDKKKDLIGLQQNVEDNSSVNTTDHSKLISKEKWFVVHAWELYNINKNLIGFRDPSEWRPIKKDHIVFYYRTSPAKQIMGIYRVVNCREGIDKNFKITKENGKREYLPYQNALELIDPFQCHFDSSDRERLSFYHVLNKSRTWGKQQVFKMSMRDVELIMNI